MKLELVTRSSCHLCEEALAAIRSVGIEPVLRDVDSDQDLFDRYDFRVPVILIDGELALEGRITAQTVRDLVVR